MGQILDEEQGLYYYGARYYLPEIGRFLSGDPDKQYSSSYVYSGNRPVNTVDRTGHWGGDVHFQTTAIVAITLGFDEKSAYALAGGFARPDEMHNAKNAAISGGIGTLLNPLSGSSNFKAYKEEAERYHSKTHVMTQ
jgi:RHS repeat-associated protein